MTDTYKRAGVRVSRACVSIDLVDPTLASVPFGLDLDADEDKRSDLTARQRVILAIANEIDPWSPEFVPRSVEITRYSEWVVYDTRTSLRRLGLIPAPKRGVKPHD